jgi:alpha-glucosidase
VTALTKEALAADALATPRRLHDAPRDWWRDAAIYEVYLRSFRDSDGDGLGDLRGVIEKIDYVADLGVDALWLSPFYPSPQKDFGYDVVDLCGVDPRAGTLDDFVDLLEAAHKRGLKVLIDFIAPHTSDEHPWFLDSRGSRHATRADWYVWADAAPDGGPPNNWLSSFGGSAWRWEPRRGQYYYHPFLKCQPALNLHNDRVVGAVCDAMRHWFDLGVDGMRLDAVQTLGRDRALRSNPPAMLHGGGAPIGGGPGNPFARQMHLFDRDTPDALDVVARLRGVAMEYQPERVLIGELADMDSARLAEKYTAIHRGLHAIYDFEMVHVRPEASALIELLRLRDAHLHTGWRLNAFGNHDAVRSLSNFGAAAVERGMGDEAARLILVLLLSLRGGAVIYQGEELGLPQAELAFEELRDPWGINLWPDFKGRDGARTPMPWRADAHALGFCDAGEPWLKAAPEHAPLAVDRQMTDAGSTLNFARAFLGWRRKQAALRWGEQSVHEPSTAPLVVFDRTHGDQRLTVVANLALERMSWSAPPGRALLDAPRSEATMTRDDRVELPPLGYAVLEERKASGR